MLNYRMELGVAYFGDEYEYVAKYPALDVIGAGDNYEEAIVELNGNTDALLQFLKEEGLPIPEEDGIMADDLYSGSIFLKTSKHLHEKVAITAARKKLTVNELMNIILIDYLECENIQTLAKVSDKTTKRVAEDTSSYDNE